MLSNEISRLDNMNAAKPIGNANVCAAGDKVCFLGVQFQSIVASVLNITVIILSFEVLSFFIGDAVYYESSMINMGHILHCNTYIL